MIGKVFADIGQVHKRLDTNSGQVARTTNSGVKQELRCPDSTSAQNDFFLGSNAVQFIHCENILALSDV